MKTAVSVPDELFQEADRLAKREGRSRSDVYSAALREYVARHSPDALTAAIDQAIHELGEGAAGPDPFVRRAASTSLRGGEW